MASTDYAVAPEPEKEAPPPEFTAPDVEKAALPPPPTSDAAPPCPRHDYFRVVDVALRLLLFAAALVAVVMMVASKETRPVTVIPIPPFVVFGTAKVKDSPAFM
ncbi:hypothetical protein RHSIM_Rhsim02G0013000 [Rhododendron simsii]|uniref:CASP-like protein n=1 Tax=Rhododendron simsii TaxID=118357 RepID=A0A834HDV9_RHOSS|nr:hypothetical protein RHSIM_Rhsim02G0013000 [Rhododendron simsii]